MTPSSSLGRGVLTNFTGIALRTSRVGFLWIVAKLYGTSEYAVYSLSFAVYDVLLFLCLAGFDNALWNFIPRYRGTDRARERSCLQTAILLPAFASLVLGAGLVLGAEPVASLLFRKPEVAPGLRWMGAILPLATLARILFAATRGLKIMKYYVIGIEMFEPLAMVSLALLFLQFQLPIPKAEGPFVAHLVAEFAVVLVAFVTTRRHFSLGQMFMPHPAWFHRETFSYSVALGGVNMSTLLSRRVDIFLVGRYLPLPQVAAYNLATEVAFIIVKIRAAFPPIMSPLLAEASTTGDHKRLRESARAAALWSTVATIPAVVLALLFGAPLMEAFGMEPRFGHAPLILLVLGHFAYTAGGPAGEVLAATGRPYAYTLFNSLPMILTLVLGPLLIPGGAGVTAAWITCAGTAVSKIPLVLLMNSKTRVQTFSLSQIEVLAAGAALAALLWALGAWITVDTPLEMGGLALLFCALFGGWIWKRKLLRAD
ncbi:MAG: oligosaccharide flippase family protein [Nitrospirae bacterium]|nr:oligosaccharide flippase family protein [Nitrospirota bacterium]